MSFESLSENIMCIALTPTSATQYISYTRNRHSENIVKTYLANFEKVRQSNLLSVNAARKLKQAINWMAYLSTEKRVYVKEIGRSVKFRLSFITLTLPSPQIHSDQEVKQQCLQPFLQWLRDSAKVKKYIWKAEIQKNGNIHFHITMDKFVHYKRIRQQWNKNINKLGYVDRYTLATGKIQPPSTEIKSVKKVKNIGAYLSAYLAADGKSKNKKTRSEYNNRIIGGRLWGVSSYLAKIKSLKIQEDDWQFSTVIKYLKQNSKGIYSTDYTTTYFLAPTMFEELTECYLEVKGFDWLIESGFDIYDIGNLPSSFSPN